MSQQKGILTHILIIVCALLFCISGFHLSAEPLRLKSIPLPRGYQRMVYPHDSFNNWIQNLPLKTDNSIIDYRGHNIELGFYKVFSVIMMPLMFKSDLEQCADFAMRLWAEFHKETGKLDKLYLFDYSGKKKYYKNSGKSYTEFLKTAFANTNSHSLKMGCTPVAADELMPGDLFVQNKRGGVGHVSVIMDICKAQDGARLFLMGYSFMPAQEFHIEKAEDDYGVEGWFTLEGYRQYLRAHLDYGESVLRRFVP